MSNAKNKSKFTKTNTYTIFLEEYGEVAQITFLNESHTPESIQSIIIKVLTDSLYQEIDFLHKVDEGYFDWNRLE